MKKRILSLILALSMVLSVLPLGAFAADPPELVMKDGLPDTTNVQKTSFTDSDGKTKDKYTGSDWEYTKDPSDSTDTGILTLTRGEYDFSNTNPKTKTGSPTNQAVACAIVIESGAEITGGTFNGQVANEGTMKGTFNGDVTNEGIIKDGTFKGTVMNEGTINNGIFEENVENDPDGTISGGAFSSTSEVSNYSGTISGGTFAAGLSWNSGSVTGGVFNGDKKLTGVTGRHSITWDAASSDAKITEVNGVFAVWDPYVVVTEETPAKTKVVTITASTEIFSLNGQPIGDGNCKSSYPDTSKKTTVKFTMPDDKDVVLSTGELVMKDGLPDLTGLTPQQGGKYIGYNWGYDSSTETLTLTYGTFDFSSTHPQGKTPGTPTTTPVACAIDSSTIITGGIFEKKVTNYGDINGGTFQSTGSVTNYGTIKDNGTFEGEVTNNAGGMISGGNFEGTVTNEDTGKINGGTFAGSVTNNGNGMIYGGTFEKLVTNGGTIEKGTFNGKVINNEIINNGIFNGEVSNGNGIITGGTFAAGLSRNDGSVTGGIFNGDTGLTDARHVTVTNGSLSQVNGVDPRNADGMTGTAWNLYSYKGTTVTITADTEIFSLNGYPIDGSPYTSSYPKPNDRTTVKFTMPDDNVVLGTGDLVMAGGYPVGTIGNGWKYSDSTLTLTRGTFDFSSTHPQGKTPGTPTTTPVACAIEIQSGVTITDGTFNATVYNGQVYNGQLNSPGGTISNGTFNGTVISNGIITGNGTFEGEVINHAGTISGGTFKKKVVNNANGTISDGTFKGDVTNYSSGTISGGTFAGSVDNRSGTVTGGVFNLKANPTNVTGYAIKWNSDKQRHHHWQRHL